jgi:NADP-dependent 3-hydroxy acid dehydrogenase YdfG
MESSLKGKVAIVTGASAGIGAAIARALAREGARVVLAARRVKRLEGVKRQIEADGGEAFAIPTDVTRLDEVKRLTERAFKRFGAIDILINNAGVMPLSLIKDLRVDEWERTIDVNLKGVLYGIATTLPYMLRQGQGHIVTIGSSASRKVYLGGAVYCATKAALRLLHEGLRLELAGSGIKSTLIEPGIVNTELHHPTDEKVKELYKEFQERSKLRPEEVAEAVIYVLSQPQNVNINELLIRPSP